jgi:hypothetical protein
MTAANRIATLRRSVRREDEPGRLSSTGLLSLTRWATDDRCGPELDITRESLGERSDPKDGQASSRIVA